jgi:LysM repeat protein
MIKYYFSQSESLLEVASRFGVNYGTIKDLNKGLDPDKVPAGEMIILEEKDDPDFIKTALSLAEKFNVDLDELLGFKKGGDKTHYTVYEPVSRQEQKVTRRVEKEKAPEKIIKAPPKDVEPVRPEPTRRSRGETVTREEAKSFHTVRRGDTLYEIADRFGVEVEEIIAWNDDITRVNKDLIHPGQRVEIRGISHQEAVAATPSKVHIVQKGEWLSRIARHYGHSVDQLLLWNPRIKSPNKIKPGDRIKLSGKSEITEISLEDKIAILKKTEEMTGVDWEILYGLSKKESWLGADMWGDGGKSVGWFQIHRGYHPHVSIQQALDHEWSAKYAADYLVELGFFKDKILALQKYNGTPKPITLARAKKVMEFAREVGYTSG